VYAPASSPPPAAPAKRSHGKLFLILGIVVVLVAGGLAGAYFTVLKKSPAAYTFNSKTVEQPEAALQQAETATAALVQSRHGTQGQDLRCYYALPATPAKGTKKSDVDQTVWCGPVLFVDGDPAAEYLQYTLTSTVDGSKVTLQASSDPVSQTPSALAKNTTFKRPDGNTPPAGPGGLTAPAPPPADADLLIATTDIGSQTVPSAPAGAVIGSINGGIRLTTLGPITRYGAGDDARGAPTGQKLIAFQLDAGYDLDGNTSSLISSTKVVVGSGSGRELPTSCGGSTCYYLLAVPTDAPSADLVLSDGGHRQTLSLLTGKPGGGNLAVLARAHRSSSVSKTFSMPVRFNQTVGFPDGASGSSVTYKVTIDGASLDWTPPGHPKSKPSKPGNALLYIDVSYTDPHNPGDTFGLDPVLMKFTPKGGSTITSKNIATSKDRIFNVFEVPASLTSGTLTISGTATETFANTGGTFTATVVTPVHITITFPAG